MTTSPGDAAARPGGPESAANCVSSSSLSVTNPVQSHFLKRQYEWLCMFSLICYKLPTHYITAISFTNHAAEFGKVGPIWSAVASSGFHSFLFIHSVLPNPNPDRGHDVKECLFLKLYMNEWKKRLPPALKRHSRTKCVIVLPDFKNAQHKLLSRHLSQ